MYFATAILRVVTMFRQTMLAIVFTFSGIVETMLAIVFTFSGIVEMMLAIVWRNIVSWGAREVGHAHDKSAEVSINRPVYGVGLYTPAERLAFFHEGEGLKIILIVVDRTDVWPLLFYVLML
ncbi:MAG TPA: hypothetical protein VKR06_27220 [Ktedonosporobacter sp.]|nr:hypothetical protein [Ktedonosporobacter sp.]